MDNERFVITGLPRILINTASAILIKFLGPTIPINHFLPNSRVYPSC